MFSEYASRFLAQSNYMYHNDDEDARNRSQTPLDRRRRRRMPSTSSTSRYVQRPGAGVHPHSQQQSSHASQSRFPFASRLARNDAQAPLFFSATAGYDDESDDHEREVEDFYALQRSRRQFAGVRHMSESEELDEEGQNHDRLQERDDDGDDDARRKYERGGRRFDERKEEERTFGFDERRRSSSDSSRPSGNSNTKLVDISLESTIDEEPPESLARLSPRFLPQFSPGVDDDDDTPPQPFQPSSMAESVPPTVILPTEEPPRHDAFWSTLFLILNCALVAAAVLIALTTDTPRKPLGDTIYTVLRASTTMLLWDTLFAVVISLIFFSLLRNYLRPLVFAMLVTVPVALTVLSLYPFISSFRGAAHGSTLQDRLMRYCSFAPLCFAVFWTWSVVKNRHALDRAIQILEFSIKILAASPALIALGFTSLATVILTSWTWLLMFERVFLSGHFSTSASQRFILSANSWWLGAFFVLQLLWTLSVIAGVQRTTTAAVVSQWYFHRLATPQPTSSEVVKASFLHSTGALFGTVCLSTFLSLMIRLPLIILPGRLSGMVGILSYWCVPEGVAGLVNPLSLTYAAVHSQPLGIAARGLGGLRLTSRTNPSNTLDRGNLRAGSAHSTLMPYRLAKLILQATRWIASIALGFGGWVRVAHGMKIEGMKGSLYAYIVGLLAGLIGFAVLGAVEGVVGDVVDAAFVCWGSESLGGRGEAKFCREAGGLFGGEDEGWEGRRGEV